jgi:hypothetical protein
MEPEFTSVQGHDSAPSTGSVNSTPGLAALQRGIRVAWCPGDSTTPTHVVRPPAAIDPRRSSARRNSATTVQSDVLNDSGRLDSEAQLRLWSPDGPRAPLNPADSLLDDENGIGSTSFGRGPSPWSLAACANGFHLPELQTPPANRSASNRRSVQANFSGPNSVQLLSASGLGLGMPILAVDDGASNRSRRSSSPRATRLETFPDFVDDGFARSPDAGHVIGGEGLLNATTSSSRASSVNGSHYLPRTPTHTAKPSGVATGTPVLPHRRNDMYSLPVPWCKSVGRNGTGK